jgi:hypothetical protein
MREDHGDRLAQTQQRPRTAPAHGRATYRRATEEEAEAAQEVHAGDVGLRTTEEQWKKYEQTVALEKLRDKQRLQQWQWQWQRERQQRRRHRSSAQTDRHYRTEWAAHARAIRSRPGSATSRASEATKTKTSGSPGSAVDRHRHCELAIDCTPTMHGPRHFPSRTPATKVGKAWAPPRANKTIEGLHWQHLVQAAAHPDTTQTSAPSQAEFANCIGLGSGDTQVGATKVRGEIPQWNRSRRQWVDPVEASSGVEQQ